MKKSLVLLRVGLFGAGLAFAAAPQDEAKSMVEEAIVFLHANGKEKTLAELSNFKGYQRRGLRFGL